MGYIKLDQIDPNKLTKEEQTLLAILFNLGENLLDSMNGCLSDGCFFFIDRNDLYDLEQKIIECFK